MRRKHQEKGVEGDLDAQVWKAVGGEEPRRWGGREIGAASAGTKIEGFVDKRTSAAKGTTPSINGDGGRHVC